MWICSSAVVDPAWTTLESFTVSEHHRSFSCFGSSRGASLTQERRPCRLPEAPTLVSTAGCYVCNYRRFVESRHAEAAMRLVVNSDTLEMTVDSNRGPALGNQRSQQFPGLFIGAIQECANHPPSHQNLIDVANESIELGIIYR